MTAISGLILKDLRGTGPLSGTLCFKRDFCRTRTSHQGSLRFSLETLSKHERIPLTLHTRLTAHNLLATPRATPRRPETNPCPAKGLACEGCLPAGQTPGGPWQTFAEGRFGAREDSRNHLDWQYLQSFCKRGQGDVLDDATVVRRLRATELTKGMVWPLFWHQAVS